MREFWMRLMSVVVIVGLILGYNSVLEARAKDEEIAKAVKIGISKINISSDIKVAFYDKCREVLNAHPEYREPLEIYPEPIKACREVIAHKVNLFDSADKVKYYYE